MFQWWQGCQNLLLWTKCQGHEERKEGGCLFGSTRWRLGLDGGSALFPGMSWSLLLETDLELFCHDKIEGICTALKSVGSAGVFSGERVGNGYIKELWDLLRGTAGWVWRFVREHQLDWIHHVQPQALWRYGHHSNHLRSNMTGHKPSFVCDPLGPLASVACSKLGNRVTSIVGAFLVSAGFISSIFATSVIYLYISMGLVVGEFYFIWKIKV